LSTFTNRAPDTRAGGGAPAMESQLSTLATCKFGVRTSLGAHKWLSCPRSDTALKNLNLDIKRSQLLLSEHLQVQMGSSNDYLQTSNYLLLGSLMVLLNCSWISWGCVLVFGLAYEPPLLFLTSRLTVEQLDWGFILVTLNLRERHLNYWASYSDTHPRERNSKRSTYHQWCAHSTKRAMATRLPYHMWHPPQIHVAWPSSGRYPQRGTLQTLCPHELKQWPGLTIPPLLVTCAMLMTYKMSSTSFPPAPTHKWSSYAGLMRLSSLPQVSTMCLLFWARATVSSTSFMHFLLFMGRLAVLLLDWRPFLVKPL